MQKGTTTRLRENIHQPRLLFYFQTLQPHLTQHQSIYDYYNGR